MSSRPTAEHVARRPPFGAPHVFVLALVSGDDPSRVHRIARTDTVIGRGDEADFSLDDEEISARHANIRVEGPVCLLTDLGSRNGTKVNGRPVREGVSQRLRHLDEIRLGKTRVIVLQGRFRAEPKRV